MSKKDFRSLSKETKLEIRRRAIDMLKSGQYQSEVSKILNVSRNTVCAWWNKYCLEGINSIIEKPKGRKKGAYRLLSLEQEGQLQEWIMDKMPDQLKLPFGLWTRKAVVELIRRELDLKIAIRTMGDYLNRWGFSPQKPIKKAYDQNTKAVEKWLSEDYPTIKKQAQKDRAEIHWGDETGVKNECQYGRSYAPKGKTPVRIGMAKRISYNMISTVTNQGQVRFMTYKGSMNSQMFIKFLKNLIKGAKNKIYLILDNLRVHHSKLVKTWVANHAEQLALYFLPSYSPELNPDEDLKYGLSERPSPKNEKQLVQNLQSHMRMLQKKPNRAAKYFKHRKIKAIF